jgi:DNA polymerase III epsilon subunit-like protein
MNDKHIIVFDFETGSKHKESCEITQIAAAVIHPRRLEIVDEFNSEVRPLFPDKLEEEALNITRKTKEKLALAPHPSEVWSGFKSFCDRYNTTKRPFTAPIAAGYNIIGFDFPILQRYAKEYKTVDAKTGVQNLFSSFICYDLMQTVFWWVENDSSLDNIKLSTIAGWLGIDASQAHDALADVKMTAEIIIKFMKMYRYLYPKIQWNGTKNGN